MTVVYFVHSINCIRVRIHMNIMRRSLFIYLHFTRINLVWSETKTSYDVYVWEFMGNIKSCSRTCIHFDIVHDSLKWIRKLINSCFVPFFLVFWCSSQFKWLFMFFLYINLINVCYAYSHTKKSLYCRSWSYSQKLYELLNGL